MNRVDRLFALLLRISDGKVFRAEDLAADFGLSQRTIYRDLNALSEIGVPLQAEPGVGYQLQRGYFLPPLLFTKDEALAVGLSLKFLATAADGRHRRAAETASKKIDAVLPESARRESASQLEILDWIAAPRRIQLDSPVLLSCMQAIRAKSLLGISYRAFGSEEPESRIVEPEKLFLAPGGNVWYLDAYCRMRQAWRSFRVDRIERLASTQETFAPRPRADQGDAFERAPQTALLAVRSADARWIRERQHWSFVEERESGETITMSYRGFDREPFVSWALASSRWIQSYAPEGFRQAVRQRLKEVERLLT